MSAPMNLRLPNKETVNLLIRTHLLLCLIVTLIVYLPMNTHLPIDIVNECLTAVKSLIVVFTLFQIVVNAIIVPKYAQNKPTTFKVRSVVKVFGVLILGSIGYHCIAVLFGAPFINSVAETFHFALLLTVTTVFPSLCVLGINFSNWVRVYAQNSPDVGAESILYCASVGSILGAWLGALPIPLDWDRPWQVWPVTCVLGNLAGYLLGLCAGSLHLYLHYNRSKKCKLT
ncbi:phosphatidylinositol-glycan biosynthesis class F protein-like [Mizuhopecten yessoensis]|uniref:phosphatidylinositol-glycan biosynthesis class F protein-like n=1 Tax=Mizuhopecten yessoensis TaxID=6573 RepID=UPI000B45B6B9|nr:phosphatidylinositol-glycan biosynthesis class F protein-like [Mizuhopecten yessoensis]